jgi:serine/threonine-protein kinase
MQSAAAHNDPFGLVGQLFDGRYEVARVIGSGSFGVVYEAKHTTLRKPCALKVLKLERMWQPKVVLERFWREARASSALRSSGAIEVYDASVEQPGGRFYYSMELLRGASLQARWLAAPKGRIAPADALACVRQVAASMAVAHEAGIVHRDLKPDNIFICDDRSIKVLDFGCAHIRHEPRLTGLGQIIGLAHYMPPEQLDLRTESAARTAMTPDPRTDIYALGVTLYHILTGRWVYEYEDPRLVINEVLAGPPPDVATVAPELPPSLCALVRRAIAREARDRFQTMGEFVSAIDDASRAANVLLRVGPDAMTLEREHRQRVKTVHSKPTVVSALATNHARPQPRGRSRWLAIGVAIVGVVAAFLMAAQLRHRSAPSIHGRGDTKVGTTIPSEPRALNSVLARESRPPPLVRVPPTTPARSPQAKTVHRSSLAGSRTTRQDAEEDAEKLETPSRIVRKRPGEDPTGPVDPFADE